jgi:hypothetical protein
MPVISHRLGSKASYVSELTLKQWSFYIFGRIIWTGFVMMILIMITLENNFCTCKLLSVSYVFFHDEFKYVFRIALPPAISV